MGAQKARRLRAPRPTRLNLCDVGGPSVMLRVGFVNGSSGSTRHGSRQGWRRRTNEPTTVLAGLTGTTSAWSAESARGARGAWSGGKHQQRQPRATSPSRGPRRQGSPRVRAVQR